MTTGRAQRGFGALQDWVAYNLQLAKSGKYTSRKYLPRQSKPAKRVKIPITSQPSPSRGTETRRRQAKSPTNPGNYPRFSAKMGIFTYAACYSERTEILRKFAKLAKPGITSEDRQTRRVKPEKCAEIVLRASFSGCLENFRPREVGYNFLHKK